MSSDIIIMSASLPGVIFRKKIKKAVFSPLYKMIPLLGEEFKVFFGDSLYTSCPQKFPKCNASWQLALQNQQFQLADEILDNTMYYHGQIHDYFGNFCHKYEFCS